MSPLALALLALGIAGLAVLVAALVLAGARRSTRIEVHATGPTSLDIRTPLGRGHAEIVVHEDHGRVYQVVTRLRGEGSVCTYVPPAAAMVRSHIAERVATLSRPRLAKNR